MLTLFRNSLPITIHPFFVLVALMIGWLNSGTILGTVIWGIIIFVSVIVHELGHATLGVMYHQSPAITLFALGGLTERRKPTRLKAWKEFLLVLNGPLFGFILALLALLTLQFIPERMHLLIYALTVTYIVNIFWTILNLFPIHPMDGGKLAMIILEHFFGARGVRISLILSVIVAVLFGILFLFIGQLLIGALFLLFAFESWRGFRGAQGLSPFDENEQATQYLKEGEELLALGKRTFAKDKFLAVQQIASQGVLYQQSQIRLAEIAYDEGEYQHCIDLLDALRISQLDSNSLKLKQKALMQLDRNKEALKLGESIFVQTQDADTAAKNALLAARLKNAKATLGWLKWLKSRSKDNFYLLSHHMDFDFLRNDPDFQYLLKE